MMIAVVGQVKLWRIDSLTLTLTRRWSASGGWR
jgi:hypothetical protein